MRSKVKVHTFDGRNPTPVEVGTLASFMHARWCRISSMNSRDPVVKKNTKAPCIMTVTGFGLENPTDYLVHLASTVYFKGLSSLSS